MQLIETFELKGANDMNELGELITEMAQSVVANDKQLAETMKIISQGSIQGDLALLKVIEALIQRVLHVEARVVELELFRMMIEDKRSDHHSH